MRTYCTPVTWAEVWAGVRRGEEHVTDAFLQARGTLPIGGGVGRRAGEYLQRFSRSHAVEFLSKTMKIQRMVAADYHLP